MSFGRRQLKKNGCQSPRGGGRRVDRDVRQYAEALAPSMCCFLGDASLAVEPLMPQTSLGIVFVVEERNELGFTPVAVDEYPHPNVLSPSFVTIDYLSPGRRKQDSCPLASTPAGRICLTLALSPLTLLTGYTYLGCYHDNQNGARIMSMVAGTGDMNAEVRA